MSLYLYKVHQVAVPVGRQITNDWLSSSDSCPGGGEVSDLRLPCYFRYERSEQLPRLGR